MPIRSFGVVSAPQAYLYSLCPPTQPPENPHEAATSWPLLFGGERYSPLLRSREIICAVSTPARSRPLCGLLRVAFAGCLCAELLLLALPLPPRPNMAGYFQQPAILWPWREGGASKRGAPRPCPRRPAPPTSLGRAFVAGSLHPQTRHTIRQREAVLRSEPCVPSAPSRPCPPFRAERSATALHNGSPLRTRTALRSGHARLYATGGWRLICTERAAADNTVEPSKLPSSAPSRPCPPFRAERSASALHNGSPLRTRTALRFGRLGGSPKAPAPLPLPPGRASRSPYFYRLLLRVA